MGDSNLAPHAPLAGSPAEPPRPTANPSPSVRKRRAARACDHAPSTRILIPVRYSAWLTGDMGDVLERQVRRLLADLDHLEVSRMPRFLLVEAREEAGPMLEACRRAAEELEDRIANQYPAIHHDMGPLWTGTLQASFPDAQPRPQTLLPGTSGPHP